MIKYVIRNVKEVQAYLSTVPRDTVRVAIEAIAKYVIGEEGAPGAGRHGLMHDDPYKQTTRAAVYGRTFESDKQRAYVMAAIRSGEIKIGQRSPKQTDASQGYGYNLTNNGYGATIKNEKPGAYWSRVWGGWKNWRTIPQVISDNMRGAIRHANTEIKKFLSRKG